MSGIDLAKYAVGATDSFQGTGVWSGIKFKRDGASNNDDSDQFDSNETRAREYTDVAASGSKKKAGSSK